MPSSKFEFRNARKSIFDALLDAKKQYGGKKPIIEDIERNPLSYDKVVLASLVLGRKLNLALKDSETVGLLIANSVGGTLAFFGLSAFGHTIAMLNFTAGVKNIKSACDAGKVKHIVSARRFVEKAGLETLFSELSKDFEIIYLEDIKDSITALDKVRGLMDSFNPKNAVPKIDPDETAVMLFTSGTEGAPKGVALSHTNLVSNVQQIAAHINLKPDWVVFNPLPIFHCFGLTGGTFLPLFTGMKTFMFPSPLQAKNIVGLVKDLKASILFGTDTFLNQYIRVADDGDLNSLEFVVCGAERVKAETREALMSKFGVTIVEGYGVTEAAPVLAVNTPDENNRHGTVGQLMPNIEWKLESVPGINGGGRLYVRGPNVMKGYVRVDAPGEVQTLPGGWHDTGDIASIDEDGFVTIRGRLKRFAKIGGEMVSLTAVESHVAAIWPENLHVAIAVNDNKKGEQIVLIYNLENLKKEALQKYYKENGISELQLPKQILFTDNVPILGTGKIDYVASQKFVEEKLGL
jgi:acyl-[acyl-carrier-protein]-phospholipid O-acyltransferase/long-chain-fatty-acid--[acyl-carrier-protein] ligase